MPHEFLQPSKKVITLNHLGTVHVHVHLPSRQDAQPPVPWRHTVEGAKAPRNQVKESQVPIEARGPMGVSELYSDGLTAVHTQADSPSTPQRGAN